MDKQAAFAHSQCSCQSSDGNLAQPFHAGDPYCTGDNLFPSLGSLSRTSCGSFTALFAQSRPPNAVSADISTNVRFYGDLAEIGLLLCTFAYFHSSFL